MLDDSQWALFEKRFKDSVVELKLFMNAVEGFFVEHQSLFSNDQPVIHSTKKRLKDISHLREKIDRKIADGRAVTPENLFNEITDLCGVRIIHLFQHDYGIVDAAIRRKVEAGDWVYAEPPKAFTWDPEVTNFFSQFDLEVQQRETFYTSVHFLLRPRADSDLCCEVQIRTLFEEIWGEVDHKINYPKKTESVACREQLMVLSKIVGAGSRLVDSIRRSLEDEAASAPATLDPPPKPA